MARISLFKVVSLWLVLLSVSEIWPYDIGIHCVRNKKNVCILSLGVEMTAYENGQCCFIFVIEFSQPSGADAWGWQADIDSQGFKLNSGLLASSTSGVPLVLLRLARNSSFVLNAYENNRKNREVKYIVKNIGINHIVLLLLASFNGGVSTLRVGIKYTYLYFQKGRYYYVFVEETVPRSVLFLANILCFLFLLQRLVKMNV